MAVAVLLALAAAAALVCEADASYITLREKPEAAMGETKLFDGSTSTMGNIYAKTRR